MMRLIYTALLYLISPLLLLRLYWKGRALPAYRQRIHERFSCVGGQPVDIWLHAVSLGEAVALTPLIEQLLNKQYQVLVTAMTPTGSAHLTKQFGSRITHQYLPYDLPYLLRRFFNTFRPKAGLIMETELWPNLIYEAKRQGIPLLLANARISVRAFSHYQKARFFFAPVLRQFTEILAQSEEDAQRFIALGAPPALVSCAGNMKFDLQPRCTKQLDLLQFKNAWGETRPVVIAASTHHNEEEQLLSRLQALKQGIPNVLLLIAPRHPERFQTVYALSQAHAFNTRLRSEPHTIDETTDVVILDSLGELLAFYQLSHYAFVGGSLVPVGGHNLLEPIAMNVPVFAGPYLQNTKAIAQTLCQADAMQQVNQADELVQAILALHRNPHAKARQTHNASQVLKANQGSITHYLNRLEQLLCRQEALTLPDSDAL